MCCAFGGSGLLLVGWSDRLLLQGTGIRSSFDLVMIVISPIIVAVIVIMIVVAVVGAALPPPRAGHLPPHH